MDRLFDKRIDNFFRVENVIFEREDLKAYEKLVYILLCRYANNNDGAFPSYETIAKNCSISRATSIRVIKKLLDKKLIEKEKRFKEKTLENTSNVYYVITAYKKDEGSITQTPPSVTQQPQVVSDRHPIKNYIKKNLNKNNAPPFEKPIKSLDNRSNFEQREYAEDDLNGLYDNLKRNGDAGE